MRLIRFGMATMTDIDALRAAKVTQEPFPYLIVPGFIRKEAVEAIEADYPDVPLPGSFPLPALRYGGNFKKLVEEISGPEMTGLPATGTSPISVLRTHGGSGA